MERVMMMKMKMMNDCMVHVEIPRRLTLFRDWRTGIVRN